MANQDAIEKLMQIEDNRFQKKTKRVNGSSSHDKNRILPNGFVDAETGRVLIEPTPLRGTAIVRNISNVIGNGKLCRNYVKVHDYRDISDVEYVNANNPTFPLTSYDGFFSSDKIVITNNGKVYGIKEDTAIVQEERVFTINGNSVTKNVDVIVKVLKHFADYHNRAEYSVDYNGTPRSDRLYITEDNKTYFYNDGQFHEWTSENSPSIFKKELPILTLDDFPDANTDYVIAYDFAWGIGDNENFPLGCRLIFDGGSIDFNGYSIPKVKMVNPRVKGNCNNSNRPLVTSDINDSLVSKHNSTYNYIEVNIVDFIIIDDDYVPNFGVNLNNVFDRITSMFVGKADIPVLNITMPTAHYRMTRPFDIPDMWSIDFCHSTLHIRPETWEGGSYVFSITNRATKTIGNLISNVSINTWGYKYRTDANTGEIIKTQPFENTKAEELKTIFLGNVQSTYMHKINAVMQPDYPLHFILQLWGDPTEHYNDARLFSKMTVSGHNDPDFYRTILVLGDANVFLNAYALGGMAIIGGRSNVITGALNSKLLLVNTNVTYVGNYHETGNIKIAGSKVNFVNCILGFWNYDHNSPYRNCKSAIEADTEDVYRTIEKVMNICQNSDVIKLKNASISYNANGTLKTANIDGYAFPSRGEIGLAYSSIKFDACEFDSKRWTLYNPYADSFIKIGEHTRVYGLDESEELTIPSMSSTNRYIERPSYQKRVCPNDKLPNNIFSTDFTDVKTEFSCIVNRGSFTSYVDETLHPPIPVGADWDDNDTMDFKVLICLDKQRCLFYTQNDFTKTGFSLREFKNGVLQDKTPVLDGDGNVIEYREYYKLPQLSVRCSNNISELPERIMGIMLVNWHTGWENSQNTISNKVVFETAALKRYGGLRLRNTKCTFSYDNQVYDYGGVRMIEKNPNNLSTIIAFTNISKKIVDGEKKCLTSAEAIGYLDELYYETLYNDFYNLCLKVEKIGDSNLRAYLNELPNYGKWQVGDEVVASGITYRYNGSNWEAINYQAQGLFKSTKEELVDIKNTGQTIELEQGNLTMPSGVEVSSDTVVRTSEYYRVTSSSVKIRTINTLNEGDSQAYMLMFYTKDGNGNYGSVAASPSKKTYMTAIGQFVSFNNLNQFVVIDGEEKPVFCRFTIVIRNSELIQQNITPQDITFDMNNCSGFSKQKNIERFNQQITLLHNGDEDVVYEGFEYYDTTLKKKLLWNGTEWVNVDGSSL